MPPPRKLSPRRKSRRSRSRSYSPKQSHRRRSRSRSPKRRSRSPHKKHGKSKRSHSRSPHRKSPSPHYPVKRPADSSGKRSSHRSHSRSRTPPKKSRDDRYHKESSPKYSMSKKPRSPSPRRRSPSPQPRRHSPVQQTRRRSTSPQTRRHSPSPRQSASSSYSNTYPKKEQLFAVGKKHKEIDLVKIVDQGPKERLDKRFQTLEQLAQGAFDFEENITIGIHRGPHHMELDEDVPVSYDFNPKTFIMLFPKKDSSRPIFDRDEIKAFHHDDVLDEEAYVEKRTITVKPSEKQRPKWMDDYKITVGQDRSNYEDRRMVQDSRSRRHRSRSRSPGYSHQEVKVRLDPKPDPRYERIYRDQQRQEESILSYDSAPRTPHDLRYSLNKRKSDDIGPPRDRDRDDRGRDMDRGSKFDARSRIQARRQDSFSGDRMSDRRDQRDRDTRDSRDQRISRDSPGRSFGDKRRYSDVKTALPDFKNRPDSFLDDIPGRLSPEEVRQRWGICQLCDVSLYSEMEAHDHVLTLQHKQNESAAEENKNRPARPRGSPSPSYKRPLSRSPSPRLRRSPELKRREFRPKIGNLEKIMHIWMIGSAALDSCREEAMVSNVGLNFGLKNYEIQLHWYTSRGMLITDLDMALNKLSKGGKYYPDVLFLHLGGNEFTNEKKFLFDAKNMVDMMHKEYSNAKIVWSQLLPRWTGGRDSFEENKGRIYLDDEMASYVLNTGGAYVRYPDINLKYKHLYFLKSSDGDINLAPKAINAMIAIITGALRSIVFRNMKILPDLAGLPEKVNRFVALNIAGKIKNTGRKFLKK